MHIPNLQDELNVLLREDVNMNKEGEVVIPKAIKTSSHWSSFYIIVSKCFK